MKATELYKQIMQRAKEIRDRADKAFDDASEAFDKARESSVQRSRHREMTVANGRLAAAQELVTYLEKLEVTDGEEKPTKHTG